MNVEKIDNYINEKLRNNDNLIKFRFLEKINNGKISDVLV